MHSISRPPLADLAAACGLAAPSIVVRRVGGPPGFYYEGTVDPTAALPAASMIKVPIAAALSRLWSEGTARIDDRIEVLATNMTANDAASPLVPGHQARLDELGRLMIARSDNVATNVLIDVIGRGRITAFARAWGLRGTAVRRKLSGSLPLIADAEAEGRNSHPASDAALLFALIASDAIPGAEWLRSILAAQEFNAKLSAGLEPGDRFLHKTGDTDEVSHDGGILELPSGARYSIVVYTALASSPTVDSKFANFMRALRPYLT